MEIWAKYHTPYSSLTSQKKPFFYTYTVELLVVSSPNLPFPSGIRWRLDFFFSGSCRNRHPVKRDRERWRWHGMLRVRHGSTDTKAPDFADVAMTWWLDEARKTFETAILEETILPKKQEDRGGLRKESFRRGT
jgi:hypothetical protein